MDPIDQEDLIINILKALRSDDPAVTLTAEDFMEDVIGVLSPFLNNSLAHR